MPGSGVRALLAVMMLLGGSAPASADEPSRPLKVTCWVVRKMVERYGEVQAESWARAKGATDDEIERAKRCLR